MMRLLQYAFLACALLCSSCKKDKDSVPTIEPAVGIEIADFAGEWRLSAWSGGTDLDKEIYLRLNADRTFTLYQNIVSHGFERFDGTFTFDSQSALIRGTYANGTPWGGEYIIGALTENSMQWQMAGTSDIATYTRSVIPSLPLQPASRSGSVPFL
nr:lipocalin family protein [uncultured Alistipes sp.]